MTENERILLTQEELGQEVLQAPPEVQRVWLIRMERIAQQVRERTQRV